MEFTKSDVIQAKNLLFAIKKGKYELDGEEVMAFGQMMTWLAKLITTIETNIVSTATSESAITFPLPTALPSPITKPKKEKKP